ncbi:MAG: hypothetical protein L0099_05540 [Acidobacteria bacterium]|nr:hypothetical protein [Acidobacteriota bacterium]
MWPVLLLLGLAAGAVAQQPPDTREMPLRMDYDMESIPEPRRVDTGYAYDFMDGTFFQQVKQAFDFPRHFGGSQAAYNINSMDEVPDSSWFTNRNGKRRMSLEEIRRGPEVNGGPAPGVLHVTRGKTSGISPGFFVRDERGDTYLFKFDPPDYPELATAAEVISTKLFYAAGYNVPQNTILPFERAQLRMDPDAEFEGERGRERRMTEADVDEILKLAARRTDGSYRVLASKVLPGKPKGGFRFSGVRRDDANDMIPHEHRRDVRGLRVFAAWLEHNDIRVGNTLDMYVTEDGRSFLRHYLIDLGSTLGSDTAFPNVDIVGKEHQFDGREAGKVLVTLGLYQQPWRLEKRELRYPSVGYYEARNFDPPRWKQNFPLVAFENMTDADGYWAARIVGSFTDEQIRAAVETGQLSDPEAARYLFFQIKERRDRILHYYAHRTTGLSGFRVEPSADGLRLQFEDVRARTTGSNPAVEYEVRSAGGQTAIASGSSAGSSIALDQDTLARIAASGNLAKVSLRRPGESFLTQVFLLYQDGRASITGIRHN